MKMKFIWEIHKNYVKLKGQLWRYKQINIQLQDIKQNNPNKNVDS